MDALTDVDVQRLGANVGLDLDTPAATQLTRAVNELLQGVAPVADALASEPTPQQPGRWPGRRPTVGEDPLNAVVRWCDVPPTGEGLLSGRTITVKDSISVAGVPTSCGYSALADYTPARDAVVIERVLAAGARVVAMTNMDAFGWAAGGESSSYGPTLNPHDLERTAGGSSSGAAATLAYPGIDIGLGTDQGGSIRIPASWCGYLGLKPTHGLVPYTGIAGIDQALDHTGPLAKDVTTLAQVLSVIAGTDESDPRQGDVVVGDYLPAVAEAPDSLRGVRIGVLAEGFGRDPLADPAVEAEVRAAIDRFAALGAAVVDVSVEGHARIGAANFVCNIEGMAHLLNTGGEGRGAIGRYAPDFSRALSAALRDHPEDLSDQVKLAWMVGNHLTKQYGGALYGTARNSLAGFRAEYDRALADVDLLVMPTTTFTAHRPYRGADVAERVAQGWSTMANTGPFNSTGHPAISLPTGSVGGQPVGTMLVAAHGRDDLLLRTARVFENHHGWTAERSYDRAGLQQR